MQAELKALDATKSALITEKEIAKRNARKPEQNILVNIRESIKKLVDEYNELANKSNIKNSIGLLTKGAGNVYPSDYENENEDDNEYFSEGDDYSFTKYGPKNVRYGWFPSSMDC